MTRRAIDVAPEPAKILVEMLTIMSRVLIYRGPFIATLDHNESVPLPRSSTW